MKILDTDFWNEHWEETCLPQTVNYHLKTDKILAGIFKKYLPDGENTKEAIEIGCAPGKWLVFFSKEMNYKISGIDFSQKGVDHTIKNFELTNVKGHVIKDDIFQFNPDKKFDIVFSLGFIEHFNDVDKVIIRHFDILDKGGYLILGIPNFKGINHLIQNILDKSVIADHNLTIMNKKYLKDIAGKLQLETILLKYIGGFEPAMFVYNSKDNIRKLYGKNTIFKRILNFLMKLNMFAYMNSRFFSSYIIAIFKK